ncbi:FAD-dependent oxidoreductase [Hydrogenophaga sp.]|uniref:FAD-dependent oxidoreductase n=1 Tax=Hydrogenophaga sp. TaxID=1904254 RepID=UPI003F6EC845
MNKLDTAADNAAHGSTRPFHDVVVVGGGPVGLATALELGRRGVSVCVVEPETDLRTRYRHPRARYVNLRVTEHFARWGLLPRMRERAEFPVSWPSQVVLTTRLSAPDLAVIDNAFFSDPLKVSDAFPEPIVQVIQAQIEEVLREELAKLPMVETRYGWQCASIEQDSNGVTVSVQDAQGNTQKIQALYAVGADGARSVVARSGGFRYEGRARIAQCVQILFRCKAIYRDMHRSKAMMWWCLNPEAPAFVMPADSEDLFLVSLHKISSEEEVRQQAPRIVAALIGKDAPFEIEGFDFYHMHARISQQYRRERIFLVGDAAHQHPTYGGHGLNLGMSDAVDLGWKLAAVLRGSAPDGLLDSYDSERRPIGERLVRETVRSFEHAPKDMVTPEIEGVGPDGEAARRHAAKDFLRLKQPQFRSIGTQLGYVYSGSPIVWSEAGLAPPDANPNHYAPDGRPGSIAPHARLADGQSLYEQFGPWFTILCFSEGAELERAKALAAAAPRAEEFCVVRSLPKKLQELYGSPIVLVRPDQHIAWRGSTVSPELDMQIWQTVLGATSLLKKQQHDDVHHAA